MVGALVPIEIHRYQGNSRCDTMRLIEGPLAGICGTVVKDEDSRKDKHFFSFYPMLSNDGDPQSVCRRLRTRIVDGHPIRLRIKVEPDLSDPLMAQHQSLCESRI